MVCGMATKLKSVPVACLSIGMLLLVEGRAPAQVDLGQYGSVSGEIEAGAIPQPVPFNNVAKYQEYRDLAQQIIVPQLRLLFGDKEQNYYARVDTLNIGQTNEMYKLRVGKYGLLDIQAEWFEIPHNFSDGIATTPYDQSGGDFTLNSKPSPPPPAAGRNIRNWVESKSHTFDLSLLEGIANLNVRYTPTPELT